MSLISRYVEFYDFARAGQHWRYVTENRPFMYQMQSYTYQNISRSRLGETADLTRNTLDLTVPVSMPLLDQFRGTSPMEQVSITLYRMRKSDSVVETLWVGEIGSVEWAGNTAVIHGLPPMAGMRSMGLQRCWQKGCPHVVFGAGPGQCNADRTAMRVNATLTSVAGAQVKAAELATKPNGWFSGGWIEWPVGTATERRFITAHVGDTLTLLTPALAAVGLTVATYPGCDGTLPTCDSKFKNSDNFGGQPWIPSKNPFGGDPIY